jgi:hypothetical protein
LWRGGIGDGATGSAGGCRERTACAWIALGQGPGNALTLGIVCDRSGKDLRLRQLERHRCRGNSDGGGRLGRRRAGRGISAWGMSAGV